MPAKSANDPGGEADKIRHLVPADDLPMSLLLSEGCAEFDAIGTGFGINADDARPLSQIYAAPRSSYFVLERDGSPAGGIGLAPLPCDLPYIAELQRFVLLPMTGRNNFGRRLIDRSLHAADSFGFSICYLESQSSESELTDLLEQVGFKRILSPLSSRPAKCASAYFFLSLGLP
jgi:putative acetyltransferase